MTIVEFIESRIAEDEAIAQAANRGDPWHAIDYAEEGIGIVDGPDDGDPDAGYSYSPPRNDTTRHITRHDPARVLRQCTMLRAMLRHADEAGSLDMTVENDRGSGRRSDPYIDDLMYRDIAAIWSDHLDYQQDWAA